MKFDICILETLAAFIKMCEINGPRIELAQLYAQIRVYSSMSALGVFTRKFKISRGVRFHKKCGIYPKY